MPPYRDINRILCAAPGTHATPNSLHRGAIWERMATEELGQQVGRPAHAWLRTYSRGRASAPNIFLSLGLTHCFQTTSSFAPETAGGRAIDAVIVERCTTLASTKIWIGTAKERAALRRCRNRTLPVDARTLHHVHWDEYLDLSFGRRSKVRRGKVNSVAHSPFSGRSNGS